MSDTWKKLPIEKIIISNNPKYYVTFLEINKMELPDIREL